MSEMGKSFFNRLNLNNIIDIKKLQKLQDTFYDTYQICTVIKTSNGENITKPSKGIFQIAEDKQITYKELNNLLSDLELDFEQIKSKEIPILIGEKHLADWKIGPILTNPIDEESLTTYIGKKGISKDISVLILENLKRLSSDKLQKITSFITSLVDQISIYGMKDLQQKNLIRQLTTKEKELIRYQASLEAKVRDRTLKFRQEHDYLTKLFENSIAGIVLCDSERKIIKVNNSFKRTFQCVGEDLRGRKLEDIVAVDDLKRQELLQNYATIQNGIPLKKETSRNTVKGKTIYVKFNAIPFNNTNGDMVIYIIYEDITSKKKAEKKLKESLQLNRQILKSTPSGIVILDSNFNILHYNQSAQKILNLHGNRLIGKNIEEAHIKWDWEKILKSVDRCKEKQEYQEITRIALQDKKAIDIIVSNFPEKDGIILTCIDVTQQIKMEQQLYQGQKLEAIGQLASGIAHELNTPSQYVGDNLLFLKSSYDSIVPLMEEYRLLVDACLKTSKDMALKTKAITLRNMEDHADLNYLIEETPNAIEESLDGILKISETVKAMKDFTRNSGTKEIVNINEIIKNSITISRNIWKYTAEINTHLSRDLPTILCLPSEFNQIMLNMIINATHAIEERKKLDPKPGIIGIKTYVKDKHIEIKISDNGIGISNDIKDRIFEPFFTTKDVNQGTGQGLAISHDVIVSKLGGSIDFQTRLKKGTTFTIRLPLEGENVS